MKELTSKDWSGFLEFPSDEYSWIWEWHCPKCGEINGYDGEEIQTCNDCKKQFKTKNPNQLF